jgi:NAD(P)-dependent dehydrogenase (short-subunit alcohol dehydrogenase family)
MIYFVTGGSRGIGAAIVLQAIREGHDVAFTYREKEARAMEIVQQAQEIDPARSCHAYLLDVSDAASVEATCERVLEDFPTVHVAVLNAGINRPNMTVAMTNDEWNSVLSTNLSGPFFVCRELLPTFLANRYGRFIFISSPASKGASGQANYAASKAGLLGLSGTLAREYGRKQITSNVILPGYFETDLTNEHVPEGGKEQWTKLCPAGRIGELNEVVCLVTFLASEKAGFINGQEIGITGGLDWMP